MKRMFVVVALLTAWPLAAVAQPRPPQPPPVPAPQIPPAPPVSAMPRIWVPDLDQTINDAMIAARDAVGRIDMDQIRNSIDQAKIAISDLDWKFDMPMHWAKFDDFDFQDPKFKFEMQMGGDAYNSGLSAITQKQYDRAITRFDQVIAQKGTHADGALYWKAFAKYKQGKADESLAAIAELRKSYTKSGYLNDARALETDVKKQSGQTVRPEELDNDDLKLLALQGLMHSDPVGTIPVIETMLGGTNSLLIKKRALYLLALSDQPRAHQILLSYAKGGGNPDVQRQAINYIATADKKQTTNAELSEIYNSTQDTDVKLAIIDAYINSGDSKALMAIASSASGPIDVRRHAINGLSSMPAPQELWQLYQKEENKDLRLAMVRAFSAEQLVQVLKTEKDPSVRRQAIRSLGNRKTEQAGPALVEAYGTETDKETKRMIINALSNQNNAEGLVGIAKKETDKDLKMELVHEISDLAPKSKVAADYLREVLNIK